jgi:Reverse transcriptase (RNA-dependent DNA polymerase)
MEKKLNNYQEVVENPIWCNAVKEELKALEKNKIWVIVPLPKEKRPIGCKWVYKIKYHSDGTIKCYKVRLVAKGYTQIYRIDYEKTFAPVAKMNTVKILLSIAVNKKWTLHQMNIKNTFFQGTLEEEVYMSLSPGYTQKNNSNLVYRFNKSIYGLKQSPRVWYDKLSSHLLFYNFKMSNADHSLFSKNGTKFMIVVLIYVDGIIIIGDNLQLKKKFYIKDLGLLKYFLGIEIVHSPKRLFYLTKKIYLGFIE